MLPAVKFTLKVSHLSQGNVIERCNCIDYFKLIPDYRTSIYLSIYLEINYVSVCTSVIIYEHLIDFFDFCL